MDWTHSRTFIISQQTLDALPAEHVANNIKIKDSSAMEYKQTIIK